MSDITIELEGEELARFLTMRKQPGRRDASPEVDRCANAKRHRLPAARVRMIAKLFAAGHGVTYVKRKARCGENIARSIRDGVYGDGRGQHMMLEPGEEFVHPPVACPCKICRGMHKINILPCRALKAHLHRDYHKQGGEA